MEDTGANREYRLRLSEKVWVGVYHKFAVAQLFSLIWLTIVK